MSRVITSEFPVFQPVTVGHVYRLLIGLSSNKVKSIDRISCKIIKIAAPVISNTLTLIFNHAIILPSFLANEKQLKYIISLCFKMAEEICLGNYRSISVLSVVSKIIERVLYRVYQKKY